MSDADGFIENQLGELHAQALALCGEGDRTPAILQGSHVFFQEENTPGDIVLNVPDDGDFGGHLLNLYLSARRVNIANPETQSEQTYRPGDWTSTKDSTKLDAARWLADCVYEIQTKDGPYCNIPLPVLHSFSGRSENYVLPFGPAPVTEMPWFGWVGAKKFRKAFEIPRGNSVTVIITPKFSPPVAPSASFRYEMRVTAVFRGSKNIHAFR
jgi:hypothetical protein